MKICYLSPPYTDLSFENQLLQGTDIQLVACTVKNPEDAIRAAKDADAIITAVVPAGADFVERLKNCRVIVRLGVGYDIVDLASCRRKGIRVCNIPDYGTEEVANHALALCFTVHRRILSYDRNVRNGRWGHVLSWPILRLSTLRVAVLGLGRIGSTFARSIKPFVRDVVGFDPFLAAEQFDAKGLARMSLESIFETSDIISLHLPLSKESHHFISDAAIAQMKRSPILINVSRGGLIDGAALARALESGKLSGAGLDVFEDEPNVRPELLALENIVLTPHVAWYSEEADLQLRRSAIEEIVRVLGGEPPKNPVV
jgi:D-3-phosphoglycerate dehydrogenase / 2-oxoglutarate reductase